MLEKIPFSVGVLTMYIILLGASWYQSGVLNNQSVAQNSCHPKEQCIDRLFDGKTKTKKHGYNWGFDCPLPTHCFWWERITRRRQSLTSAHAALFVAPGTEERSAAVYYITYFTWISQGYGCMRLISYLSEVVHHMTNDDDYDGYRLRGIMERSCWVINLVDDKFLFRLPFDFFSVYSHRHGIIKASSPRFSSASSVIDYLLLFQGNGMV